MTDAPFTLKNFFVADAAKPVADQINLAAVTAAVTAVTAALPPAAGAKIADAFHSALDEIFSVGLGDVLQASWGTLAALGDAMLATRKDPNSMVIVPLLDHKIASKHQPHIDLMYGEKCLAQISFDLLLNLALKGVMLEIRQGRIVGLKAGSCLGEGVCAFASRPLIQHKLPEFSLPGKLAFTPPRQGENIDGRK